MSQGRELLLSEGQQLELTMQLHERGYFGIVEDEADYITLKSERRSPHYLDMRKGISFEPFREMLGDMMEDLAHARVPASGFDYAHEAYARVAGTPEAMTSYIPDISRAIGVPLVQPRVDLVKISGNKTPVLGEWNVGDNLAAVDDVVTDGKSKIDLINGLRGVGLRVLDYFVVLDREEGGAGEVQEATGIEIVPMLSLSNMVLTLSEVGAINGVQRSNVVEYLSEYGDPVAKEALGI